MCDNETKSILQSILDTSLTDDYEQGGIFTLGGPSGNYIVKSPYNTEAEYSIVFASVSGTTGDVIISISHSNPVIPATSSQVYGLASGGGETTNAFEGWMMHVSSTGASPTEYWAPLGRGGYVYLTVNSVSGNCFVQIAFRRKLERYIPDKPRPNPVSHSHVASRRPMRTLGGLSKMLQGYEQQYPTLGDNNPYEHENIPEDQDTGNVSNIVVPGRRRVYRGNR